jgi:hypothetical protein
LTVKPRKLHRGESPGYEPGSNPRFALFTFVFSLLGSLPIALAFAQTTSGDIPRMADGKPDLSGVWQALNTAYWDLEPHGGAQGVTEEFGAHTAVLPGAGVVVGGEIPYLESALAQRAANRANRATEDIESKCYLPGVPRATYLPHPFQIFQGDGGIFIAYQYAGAVRTIYMDSQMQAPVNSWMGWSNGRWEGDTLVIEVTGLNGESWLDRSGNYLSSNATVTERYTPIGPNHIAYEATIEDPTVYSRPWTIRMPIYRRIEDNAQLLEFKCIEFAEELLYGHLSKDAEHSDAAGGEQ